MRRSKIGLLIVSVGVGLGCCALSLASCAGITPDAKHITQGVPSTSFFTAYPSYDEITAFAKAIAAQAPELVQISEIGRSVQGRPIYAVKVGTGKDALYIDAAHHGNEIITPMVALYFLKYLVEHRSEPEISGLLSTRTLYVIPCVNPDGYTARQRVNVNGVDPNRNYSEAWRPSNADEDDSISPGSEPFSEPETRTVRDFIGAHPDIKIALTLHSGIDRIHYSRQTPDKPTGQDYSIYTRLSEEGRLLTANLGCGPAGVSPLTISPTGGGRGTTLSWLHSRGLYGFTIECYGDGIYPWPVTEKYYPPEAYILDICKRWVPFEVFMLRSVSHRGAEITEIKTDSLIERKIITEALEMIKPITGTIAPGETIRRLFAERKDVVDDPYRLEKVQASLDRPLELPGQCDRLDQRWQNARTLSDALQIQIDQLGERWTISRAANADFGMRNVELDAIINKSPKEYQPVLKRLLYAIYESQALLEKAFEKLSVDERKYLVKNILPELILDGDKIKDDFQIEAEKVQLRLAPPDAKPETHGRDVIDPEQKEGLKLTLKIDYGALHQAGMLVASAVDDAIEMLITDPDGHRGRFTRINTDIVFTTETPYGRVVIGGIGNNVYDKDILLIIDLGGNDRYLNRAGGAIGVTKPVVSVVIDVSGQDYYAAERKFSQGSALFGIGALADLSGNDTYQAGHYSQGCGMFGIGMLWDKGMGNDDFSAGIFCQGAGGWGIGLLYDEAGDTKYYSRTFSQGLGYTLGAGALVDKAGDDYYLSAGTITNDRPYSMSQGFGQGQRPIASGGIGTLIDSAGNDHYSAYFYAQGCAYWYGLGILMDNAGNDRYDAQVYAQGCGIHLSTGVLIDRAGSDFYNCTYGGNAQGAAHDLAVGILIDKNGKDTYIGCGNNQGSAITNAFALFIDGGGDDVYHTTPKGGQGWGSAARGYGSIGLFIDEGGNDFYSEEYLNPDSGTGNGRKWIKGDKGAGIDTETRDEHR